MLKLHCDRCGAFVSGITTSLKKVDSQYLCPKCVEYRRQAKHIVVQGIHRCPYCHEEIQPAAVKCKHCGEFLIEELKQKIGR